MFYKKNIKEKRARAQRVPLIVGCVRACVCVAACVQACMRMFKYNIRVRACVHAYV
jgi:hypothetical protein